jgi:hypothetical protein
MLIVNTIQKARWFAIISLVIAGSGVYYASWLAQIASGFSGQGGGGLLFLCIGMFPIGLIGFYFGREAAKRLKTEKDLFYWIAFLGKWISLLIPVFFVIFWSSNSGRPLLP